VVEKKQEAQLSLKMPIVLFLYYTRNHTATAV